VIKCDSGIKIAGLNGFPGPYSSFVERTLGADGLLRLCETVEDRQATIYSVVAFCDERLDPVTFYGEVPGVIQREERGTHGYFFDSIFVPSGSERTLAQFDDSERWVAWKGPYVAFAEWYMAR
jgi:XTP/dITP diphosphohydrolase